MIVGITATRKGLTPYQKTALEAKLRELKAVSLHHGDCQGGDADAHEIGRKLHLFIVGHLPSNPSQRALCDFDEIRYPKPYLERNRNIVNESDYMIALPSSSQEELRSGTWATIRYARRGKKGLVIIPGDTNGQA